MNVEALIDTNVLVYAAAGRGPDDVERRRALALIDEVDFGLSAQVLQEFYVTVVHKVQQPVVEPRVAPRATRRPPDKA